MRKLIFCFIAVFLGITSCKKSTPDNTQYTVKGRIINATNSTFYIGSLYLDVDTAQGTPSQFFKSQQIATGNTDAEGYFSLTYTHTFTDHGAEMVLESNFFSFGGIPLNQNDSQNFYNSSAGSLKIFLQTKNPLELNHDTLFLGMLQNVDTRTYQFDTVTKTVNGYYKTIRCYQPPWQAIFYGRGIKNFTYEPQNGGFSSNTAFVNAHISGDPIVDSITVNY